jgi:hypothetical protein
MMQTEFDSLSKIVQQCFEVNDYEELEESKSEKDPSLEKMS